MGWGVNKYRLKERRMVGGRETREYSLHLALKEGRRIKSVAGKDLVPC